MKPRQRAGVALIVLAIGILELAQEPAASAGGLTFWDWLDRSDSGLGIALGLLGIALALPGAIDWLRKQYPCKVRISHGKYAPSLHPEQRKSLILRAERQVITVSITPRLRGRFTDVDVRFLPRKHGGVFEAAEQEPRVEMLELFNPKQKRQVEVKTWPSGIWHRSIYSEVQEMFNVKVKRPIHLNVTVDDLRPNWDGYLGVRGTINGQNNDANLRIRTLSS